jgi:hypothetical protein
LENIRVPRAPAASIRTSSKTLEAEYDMEDTDEEDAEIPDPIQLVNVEVDEEFIGYFKGATMKNAKGQDIKPSEILPFWEVGY